MSASKFNELYNKITNTKPIKKKQIIGESKIKKTRFNEIYQNTIDSYEFNNIINEGIADTFAKLKNKGISTLKTFSGKLKEGFNNLYKKIIDSIVKPLIEKFKSKEKLDAGEVQNQLKENPLVKSVLDEVDVFGEVKASFSSENLKDILVKSDKKGENVAEESIQAYKNYIITEDLGEKVTDITTKIFSTVFNLLAKALGAIGWVIKPELRNWYDKLVRKVWKLFGSTKAGQSINDLPPDVKVDVVNKFKAIIGLIITVVVIIIIYNYVKGNGDIEEGNGANGASSNNEVTDVEGSDGTDLDKYEVSGKKPEVSQDDMNTFKGMSNKDIDRVENRGFQEYVRNRQTLMYKNPKWESMSTDEKLKFEEHAGDEYYDALEKGVVLKIENGKIIEVPREEFCADNIASHGAAQAEMYRADGPSNYNKSISLFKEPEAVRDQYDEYIEQRVAELQKNPDFDSDDLDRIQLQAEMEAKDALAKGKLLYIDEDGEIQEIPKDDVDVLDKMQAQDEKFRIENDLLEGQEKSISVGGEQYVDTSYMELEEHNVADLIKKGVKNVMIKGSTLADRGDGSGWLNKLSGKFFIKDLNSIPESLKDKPLSEVLAHYLKNSTNVTVERNVGWATPMKMLNDIDDNF